MSQTNGDRSGPAFQEKEVSSRVDHIRVLLDYLQRKPDDRLQAHFEDTRQPSARAKPVVAAAPCKSYFEFLTRLSRIERGEVRNEPSGDPSIDDITFLRSALDFLAALAAPASAESIKMTHDYIDIRAKWANESWREWVRRIIYWLSGDSKKDKLSEDPGKASGQRSGFDKHSRPRARWLARSAARLEHVTFVLIPVTVALSAYAMVGHLIIDNEKGALAAFSDATKLVDADRQWLAEKIGLQVEARFERLGDLEQGHQGPGCPVSFDWTAFSPAQWVDSSRQTTPASAVSDPEVTSRVPQRAFDMSLHCLQRQWKLTAMMNGNLSLRSWENAVLWFPLADPLVGWSPGSLRHVGTMLDPESCARLAHAYSYRVDLNAPDCKHIMEAVGHDSPSLASSILTLVGVSILPCLYALIGAAAATLLHLGRQTDRSLLSYTDRGRIKYNLLLGLTFGAIIALVAGYLPSPTDVSAGPQPALAGLGLSALAFLAGYNVNAMLTFLDSLSRRIFNVSDEQAPPARAAER